MTSTVRVNGKVKATPGSYTQVDASGLEQVSLGSSGIVALIGEAVGGKPLASTGALSTDRTLEITSPDDFIRLTTPEQVRSVFRSGNLREGAAMLFDPSTDPAILGGAQQVVAMKVNPDVAATGTMDISGTPVIDLTSVDFGAHTNQIRYSLSTATSPLTGYALSIEFEGNTESVDGLGGDAVASLAYTTSADTWDTITVSNSTASSVCVVTCAGTYLAADHSADALTSWAAGDVVNISGTAADAGKVMRIYGLVGAVPTIEDVTLDASGDGTSTNVWAAMHGAHLSAPAEGAVTFADDVATHYSFSIGQQTKGGIRARAFYVADTTLTLTATSGTQSVHLYGNAISGASSRETVAATTGGVATSNDYFQVEFISTVAVTDTVTLSGNVVVTDGAAIVTLLDAYMHFEGLTDVTNGSSPTTVGFAWTNLIGDLNKPLAELDELSGLIAANHPTTGLSADFTADLYDIVDWINNNSQYMTAAVTGNNISPPDTFTARFLTGGAAGTTLFSDWQRAIDLLRQDPSINTIVPLTGDSAVHAAVQAHCAYMGGEGKAERDAILGAVQVDSAGTPTTSGGAYVLASSSELRAQAIALNSRHVRMVGQGVRRYSTTGVLTWFDPWFLGCLAAGMQAGSSVGVSLTHKYLNAVALRQATSWNPKDYSDELIQGGVMIAENIRGLGNRWVRNNTTYLQSTNLAYQEGSVNEAVNFATRSLREALEAAVGEPGFAGTLSAVRSRAINILGLLIDEGVIVAWGSLSLTLSNDLLNVSVELAPTLPINFVLTTVHLTGTSLTA